MQERNRGYIYIIYLANGQTLTIDEYLKDLHQILRIDPKEIPKDII